MTHDEAKSVMLGGKAGQFWREIELVLDDRIKMMDGKIEDILGAEEGDASVARKYQYKKSVYKFMKDLPELIVQWSETGKPQDVGTDPYA